MIKLYSLYLKLFRLLVRNDFYAKLTARKGWRTLEESKEVIPMMEAMITQIEEQQNLSLIHIYIMTKSSLPVGGYSVNPYVGCTPVSYTHLLRRAISFCSSDA